MSKFNRGESKKTRVSICGATSKRMFKSHEAAVNFVVERAESMPAVMRAYRCDFCSGWHLTSQAIR